MQFLYCSEPGREVLERRKHLKEVQSAVEEEFVSMVPGTKCKMPTNLVLIIGLMNFV
jgi:hypothetical protein